MLTALGLISLIVIIIFLINSFASKSPSTSEEILADIKSAVNKINEQYDFENDINIQSIENLKTKGWYVSDCGDFYHIISFESSGLIKLSSASKEELKKWDRKTYMDDIVMRLNKNIDIASHYEYPNNQLILTFPSHPTKIIRWYCKLKANGVLIVRKYVRDKCTSLETFEEVQYLWMDKYHLGYDIKLYMFLSDE